VEKGTGVVVGVAVAVAVVVGVALGVAVGVGVGLVAAAQYLPPVFDGKEASPYPPQTIIWLPVHTAVCNSRPAGAPVVVVAVQLSVLGS
jgi:hypothetical protein